MAWHFVIRMYNIAPWMLLHCIYSIDIISKRSHGRIFLTDWHGIQRNCLQKQAMCMNRLQIILIEKFVIRRIKRRDVNISMNTHTGRHEGCKLADMLDVLDALRRLLGRWDHNRMIQYYSLGLPRQGARIFAGHGSNPDIFLAFFQY